MSKVNVMNVYIGTYTVRGSVGIYRAVFDPASGSLEIAGQTACDNPSFLALGPDGRVLYAVHENDNGAVSAFSVHPESGDLTPLGERQETGGSAPCHLTIDGSGRWVVVANYSSGNGAVFPIKADGSLGAASDRYQHTGSGPNTKRQEGPHAHSATFDSSGSRVYVADLGIDHVMIYDLDQETGKLRAAEPASAGLPPGSGPRHMAFHQGIECAYVINELGSTISVFRRDRESGALEPIQTVSTLPAGFSAESSCADIHIHPNGQFVYGSNRGHDSIAIFSLNEVTGELTAGGHMGDGVAWPRNFALDPQGKLMLVANKNGDDIVTFAVDGHSGALSPTGLRCEIPSPVCVIFAG